ncbi:MAG: hypothetical protein E7556_01980 [Ruminococcaceae bacterium]|nr:hypothetical protein [Oscillospiraceae bacterium]
MKKKILAVVLVMSLIMTMFALTVTTGAQSTVLGDADNSGDVTSNDALLVLRAAAGIEDNLSDEAKALCDIDGDGYISLFDARRILRAAAGLTNLAPTGKFKGYTDRNQIFGSQEEALTFFNINLNKIKSEKFGFTALTDVEMKEFKADKITLLGQEAQNTATLIEGIMNTIGSDSDEEYYVAYNTSSTNKMSVEGQSYVTRLTNQDVLGMKVEYDATRHPENGGVITITIAIPDTEKVDINDSSYIKVFNSENLLGATETAINTILTKVADGTEVVHYKNAVLVAEFEADTGYPVSYSTSYETNVFIADASRSLYTFENLNYKTENKVDYIDFIYD